MDVKYVLTSILREASRLGAKGELIAGVRLSGAVNSERGEGYLMLYSDGLVLLYRKLGKRDYEGCFASLLEWSFDNYREEKYILALDVHCRNECFSCEFTPSERESAEEIINQAAAAQAEPRAIYSESTLLMAAILCKIAAGEQQYFLEELLGKQLYMAAGKYISGKDQAQMIAHAGEIFSEEQKKSVLLNLIELSLSDNLWTGRESAFLRDISQTWLPGSDFFEEAAGMLLLRRKLGNLFMN